MLETGQPPEQAVQKRITLWQGRILKRRGVAKDDDLAFPYLTLRYQHQIPQLLLAASQAIA
jgi:hypothetical protein